MFRNIFGVLAALIVTTGAASAGTVSLDTTLEQRLAKAQGKLEQLGRLAEPGAATDSRESCEDLRLAQHWHNWHNHHWNNWNNWHNHHWGNHRH